MRLGLGVPSGPAAKLLETDAQGHRRTVADRLAGHFDELAHEAHAIFDRAAVRVGAPVVLRQQELVRKITHPRVNVDDVESGAPRLARAFGLPREEPADVVLIHRAGTLIAHEADVGRHPRNARGRQRR